MATTPRSIRVPVEVPLYVQTVHGEYVQVGVITQQVDVQVSLVPAPQED